MIPGGLDEDYARWHSFENDNVNWETGQRMSARAQETRGRRIGGITRRDSLKAMLIGGAMVPCANSEDRTTSQRQRMKVFEFIEEKGRPLAPENPAISGGNPWLKWCDCEPTEGQYCWTRMDEAIAVWSALGKKAIIRVDTSPYWLSSEGTPQWVFDAGAGHIEHPTTGEVFPVYWDPVYLRKWANFVRAFGSRYDSNRNIEFVQTGGAGWFGEMHLGRTWSKRGLQSLEPQWRAAGYTPTTYAKACRFIIDRFMESSRPSRFVQW